MKGITSIFIFFQLFISKKWKKINEKCCFKWCICMLNIYLYLNILKIYVLITFVCVCTHTHKPNYGSIFKLKLKLPCIMTYESFFPYLMAKILLAAQRKNHMPLWKCKSPPKNIRCPTLRKNLMHLKHVPNHC
jgi:hypothetical protein